MVYADSSDEFHVLIHADAFDDAPLGIMVQPAQAILGHEVETPAVTLRHRLIILTSREEL